MEKIINIQNIDPNTLQLQNYSPEDEALISNFTQDIAFNPSEDYLEYFILDLNQNTLFSNVAGYPGYTLQDGNVVIDPQLDLESQGYDEGQYYTIYNFLKRKLSSSPNSTFYIQDISTDRTELRLNTTKIPNTDVVDLTTEFAIQIANNTGSYLDFYLNFGDNQLVIANNIALDNTNPSDPTVLIKLYEPLPEGFTFNTQCWIVEQIAESQAYQIELTTIFSVNEQLNYIGGPNFNLNIQDQINNSTPYQNLQTLQSNTSVLGSGSLLYQINSILAEKGIEINIDYSDYSQFVHFSSAQTRLENFYYKLALIEEYTVSSSYSSGSTETYSSASQVIWDNRINNIITNFDGYEYYLYYNSESHAWPKTNSTAPYVNYSVGSATAISWLNTQLESASFYDSENKDALVNAVPTYLKEDSNNDQYMLFIQMIGQHFDNVWVYLKDITNKFDADNRLEFGISKDIVAQAIRDLGVNIYQNNFSTDDVYSSLLGLTTSGSNFNISTVTSNLPASTGLEYINTFITASDPNALEPLDDVNKEIYKRIYHNLPYLLKKKGTTEGLRSLITTYGIPDTLLRITEYGGKDKTNVNDWDYWYNYFSYAFNTQNQAQPLIPWLPLLRNFYNSQQVILPDTIALRFKTEGIPETSPLTQNILLKKTTYLDDEYDFGVFLTYTGSGYSGGSYSGSIPSESKEYGNLKLVINGNEGYFSSPDITLPFFDGGWWSIMLKRDTHISASGEDNQNITYTLYAKNKIYDGVDGYKIGFQGSSSITIDGSVSSSYNASWNNFSFYVTPFVPFGTYLGGYYNGVTDIIPPDSLFSGSFQEFRYYSNPISEATFDDYVMNPKSIEGNTIQGSGSSKDLVDFRAPLGNLLEETYYSNNSYETYTSLHPAITGSCITESFWNGSSDLIINASVYGVSDYADPFLYFLYGNDTALPITIPDSHSNYDILYHIPGLTHTLPQTEVYYVDTPIVGLLTPNSNKIKDVPSTFYGNVLSSISSLQQNYEASQSYTKDNNYLEVAFSPQNEINDDIAESLGYFDVGKYIGDPQYRFTNNNTYPDLNKLRDEYFCKYVNPYNLNDYIRLIKYFDNSLFKLIKDFTPAKTNLASGLVIKPHFLERNRYQVPSVEWEKLDLTASIDTAFISGGIAGGFSEFGGEDPFIRNFIPDFTQSWEEIIVTPLGLVTQSRTTQDEFYNGEFSGSIIQVYEEQINPFLDVSTKGNSYTVTQYIGDFYKKYILEDPNATAIYYLYAPDDFPNPVPGGNDPIPNYYINESNFLNPNTEPDPGEIYLFNIAIDSTNTNQNFIPSYYYNKYIKISKFDSNNNDNSAALEQATQINISLKTGPTSIENIPFTILEINEYPTYYLYYINSNPFNTLYFPTPIPDYGFLYLSPNGNLVELSTSIINIDNEKLSYGVKSSATANFLTPNTNNWFLLKPGNGFQFTPTLDFDDQIDWFDINTFSYKIKKTPNLNNYTFQAIGSFTLNKLPATSITGLLNVGQIALVKIDASGNIIQFSNSSFSPTHFDIFGDTILPFPQSINFDISINFNDLEYINQLPVKGESIGIAVKFFRVGFNITNFNLNPFTIGGGTQDLNTSDPINIEPGFEINFTNNDYNALFGNASEARRSQYYMDVDYSTSPIVGSSLTPINFDQLIDGTATRAQVQDYYYNLQRHTIPRYNGSKTTAAKFNEYTAGDTGYGKEIVAGNLKPFVGYYTSKGGSTPEVLGKTIVNLDYIIDENISTQVPALSDFTYNNQIQLFERGKYLYLDPDKNSAATSTLNRFADSFAGNNKYKIYRSGEYATPILYSQTGSSTGFLDTLTFLPPGIETIPQFLSAKYIKNTSTTLQSIKQSLYWRVRSDQYPAGKFGFNTFIGNSWPGENPNPVQSFFVPDPVKSVPNFTYPHTWNQIPIDSSEQIYNINNNLAPTFDNVVGGTPYSRGSFTIPSSGNPEISCKAKFTITIKWAPTLVNTTLSDSTSVNFQLNTSLPQANSKRIINPLNTPLSVGFRIMGTAIGWDFTQITPDQTYTLSPGETKTITVETDILPRNGGYVFVQGYAFFPNDYLEPSFFNIPGGITFLQEQFFNTTAQNRLNWFDASFTVLSSELEFIQVPEANEVEINYTPNTPYITTVVNSLDFITTEGNSSLALVQFTSSFAPALGLIYPQIPNSGYDATIYPFEFPDNYQLDNLTTFLWLVNGASQFGATPPPPGTFDYEIRFNADENQSYPIVGYYYDENNSNFVLIILRPIGAILTSDNADGPVPIENYQSFLIRRWIPRAGYIYLDVDAPLGKGIIKPEFITNGIQAKIPQIIKELTDKGLIT